MFLPIAEWSNGKGPLWSEAVLHVWPPPWNKKATWKIFYIQTWWLVTFVNWWLCKTIWSDWVLAVLNIYACIEDFFFKTSSDECLKDHWHQPKNKFILVETLYQHLKTTSCKVLLGCILLVGTSWCQFCSFELFSPPSRP